MANASRIWLEAVLTLVNLQNGTIEGNNFKFGGYFES